MHVLKHLALILFFMGMTSPAASADFLSPALIHHQAAAYFAAETRLLLEVQLNDSRGVAEARCYFKTDLDRNYLYVSMDRRADDSYSCSLPGLRQGAKQLEYFFLMVNGSGQVIRSTPYLAGESPRSGAFLEQPTAAPRTILPVYSELGISDNDDTGIHDDRIERIPITNAKHMYGLWAGVYELEDIPESLHVMSGYFGGFIFDGTSGTVQPVKGFAPNLESLLLDSDFATESYGNAVKVPRDSALLSEPRSSVASSSYPQIGGDNWAGYFTRTDSDVREDLTASVVLSGSRVTITTTLTGLGHYLAGTMNSRGDMLLYDSYDGEDWTTHYGPATSTEINIYDYIWRPVAGQPPPPLNAIILYRPPPLPPAAVQASDGLFPAEILVTWDTAEGATFYAVHGCGSDLTGSCTSLAEVGSTEYVDTRSVAGQIIYRIKACNAYGCSQFSDYDIGFNQLNPTIAPIVHLLLRSG